MQPVSVPCYQQVPVTEYQPVREKVTRPVCRTEIIDEPVTAYRPVEEIKTAQVPYCVYQPVTEYIPQTRDCGSWQTYCQCIPRMSPCQYDPSPGIAGWMNRTGYAMRMAFTPTVTYPRRYVPNYVTTMIPVTRQVAQRGVREVAYKCTRLEAYRTVRKVAMNRVDYETAEVVVHRPITVMRTVPVGTSVAWVPFGSPTATALLPGGLTPDPISREARAIERAKEKGFREGKKYEKDKEREELREGALPLREDHTEVIPQRKPASNSTAQLRIPSSVPTVVQANGWTARTTYTAAYPPQASQGGMSVVDSHQ